METRRARDRSRAGLATTTTDAAMAHSDSADIIDISDSDISSGGPILDNLTSRAAPGSDSVVDIPSTDSEALGWSDSEDPDEFSNIIGQLNLNNGPNILTATSSKARSAPLLPTAPPNDTIILSSSEDELSSLPLAIQQPKPKDNITKTSKVLKPLVAVSKPGTSSWRVLQPVRTIPSKVIDLKGADAKLHRDVNKLVTDRKSTIKDFTLEISHSLQDLPFVTHLNEKLAAYDGKLAFFKPPIGVENLVRFRRQHIARYDSSLKEWIPVEVHTRLEDLYILFLFADRLAQAATEDRLSTMFSDLRNTHQLTSHSQIFLVVDGMGAYYAKQKRTKKATESSLTYLQATERCFVVHVDGPEDTAQWLFNITADLGIKPHKRIRDSFLPFCTDTKIKCGISKNDTYKKMLQQIHGITESAADGIVQEVPTLRMLFEGYDKENDELVRHERLKTITISNRKDGVAKSRILNQALSKKVHDVIWGEDPLTLVL